MPGINRSQVVNGFTSAVLKYSTIQLLSVCSGLSTIGIHELSALPLGIDDFTLPVSLALAKNARVSFPSRDLL